MSHSIPEEEPASLYNVESIYSNVLWRIVVSIGLIALAIIISS